MTENMEMGVFSCLAVHFHHPLHLLLTFTLPTKGLECNWRGVGGGVGGGGQSIYKTYLRVPLIVQICTSKTKSQGLSDAGFGLGLP